VIPLTWVGAGVIAAYLAGVGSGMLWSADRAQAKRDKAAVAQLIADLKAQQDQAARLHKAKDATDVELETARAAAARAARTADSLRNAARTAEARLAAAPAECKTEAATGLLFADVFRGASEEAVRMAGQADDARARGIGCENHYEAVKGTP
jgi:chromosome segregation ATPase